uniref:Uncharacterized protein n=1 Tax=Triticum urartu TaxID=4572 RepID=A0A8R7UFJ3_TRIUA
MQLPQANAVGVLSAPPLRPAPSTSHQPFHSVQIVRCLAHEQSMWTAIFPRRSFFHCDCRRFIYINGILP